MKSLYLATLLVAPLLGCRSGAGGADGSPGSSGPASSPAASGTQSAASAPAVPSAMAAVRAGKLTHPTTKEELKLVETSLGKCYGFKAYSMMLPEGTTFETPMGARACIMFLPKAHKKIGIMVMTDEIKVKMWQRTDLENVKNKHLDDPDAFVYEVEDKGKTRLTGWTDGKVGPHRVQCNSTRDEGTMTLDDELAFVELCRTLKYTEPAK